MKKIEILLNFYNTQVPFIFKKENKYFISNVAPGFENSSTKEWEKHSTEYTDDVNILLNAIKKAKSFTYQEMSVSGKTKTKEDYWQNYFNYMYSGKGGLILWHNPTESWNSELSRRGELPCKKCGNAMTMYYVPTCFYCEKPEKNKRGQLMFIPVCYYIALKNKLKMNTIKKALWDEFVQGNDIPCNLYFTGKKEIDSYLSMINKEFPIEKNTFFVFW